MSTTTLSATIIDRLDGMPTESKENKRQLIQNLIDAELACLRGRLADAEAYATKAKPIMERSGCLLADYETVNAKLKTALILLGEATEQDDLMAPNTTWFRRYYELSGQHMILTEDGWEHGSSKPTYIEQAKADGVPINEVILDEVNAPISHRYAPEGKLEAKKGTMTTMAALFILVCLLRTVLTIAFGFNALCYLAATLWTDALLNILIAVVVCPIWDKD